MYDSWIDIILGPELSRCDVTDIQRKTLLTIAVSYRAFSRSDHPGVDTNDFDIFAGRLATAARALGPYDRADGELIELVDYLELTLPEVCGSPLSRYCSFSCFFPCIVTDISTCIGDIPGFLSPP